MQDFVLHGPPPYVPLDEGTAGQQLHKAFLSHLDSSDATIDVHTREVLSYRHIFETTCKLAESLRRIGYGLNSVISVCSENNLRFFHPVVAALYLGVAVAPLNENYAEGELHNAIGLSKPTLFFCSKRSVHKILKVKKRFPFIQKIIVLDSSEDVEGSESLQNFIARNCGSDFNPYSFRPASFDANEQVALIMCSSGTTGLPKGVMLTHRNLAARFAHCKDPALNLMIEPKATVLTFMPFFHAFGLIVTLGYFIIGLRIVVMQRFDLHLFLKGIQDYRVKSVYAVPPVVVLLAKNPLVEKYDLTSLQELGCGAAPLGREVGEAVKRRLNLPGIRQAYGLTECTLAVTLTPDEKFRPGSSGTVVPFMSAKVIDLETGASLGPSQTGELCFRGAMTMKGYVDNEEATRATIDSEGWVHTGDVGYYDHEGHFYIVDRVKELIKYKGFQVPPAELEALLLQHPCVKDAAVIGIPDDLAGELPAAFVVKQVGKEVTEKEISDFVAKNVSSAKRLRGGVRFLQEIPKNPTGKILRRDLRDLAQKLRSKL